MAGRDSLLSEQWPSSDNPFSPRRAFDTLWTPHVLWRKQVALEGVLGGCCTNEGRALTCHIATQYEEGDLGCNAERGVNSRGGPLSS